METIKYFILGMALAALSVPANAQNDSKTAIEQIASILKDVSEADNRIAEITEPFKDNPDVLIAIGREYMKRNNVSMAEKYANMAITANKSYNDADALLTDISNYNGNNMGTAYKADDILYDKKSPKSKGVIYDVVDQMPSFPGGNAALMEYLSKDVKYPTKAQEKNKEGRVVVKFVVEKDGSITNVSVTKSVDPSLDREAVRVVRKMPKWNPGKKNGATVRVRYRLPIAFRIN